MIILWFLVIEVLVKNILLDNNYRKHISNNENINRDFKIIASILYRVVINFIQTNFKIDKSNINSLEYYHNLTSGSKNPVQLFEFEKDKKINDLKKKIKNEVMDSEYVSAYGKYLNALELEEDEQEEQIILYKMNKIIKNNDKDKDYMEITSINNSLYQQRNLKIYSYCSQANNFNLIKIIWDWIDVMYKLVNNVR